MDLLISFLLLMAAMAVSLAGGITMMLPLALGLIAFALVGRRRGYGLRSLLGMCAKGMREAGFVAVVMLLIGCLTSLWRQSGTIAYFSYYGVKLIPPQIFILCAFLLTALMSYALGTSFGVAGTIGVILMTIARASGVSLPLVGGAIISGLYFGDRGSPVSSSANLVASETHTQVDENLHVLLKTSLLPMGICTLLYALLSFFSHPSSVDTALLSSFEAEFHLSFWCLLPTVLLLIPAFLGMKVRRLMIANIFLSIALTYLLQETPILEILRMMLLGYAPKNAALAPILSGGGVLSMFEVVALLMLSSGCAGIFEGTHMLSSVEGAFEGLSARFGRFPAMIAASIAACMVFCNQTIGIIMCRQCMSKNYPTSPEGRGALMLDIENSVVVLAGLVPWCIACSVPLRMLDCGYAALPFAAYLWLLPLCWQIHRRREDLRAKREGRA